MYHYTESGLNDVWLSNGYTVEKTPHGDATFVVDVKGLHKAIALHLIQHKPNLSGPEFRYLRRELDLSQPALGHLMGKDAQSIARWEKQGRVPKIADRILRVIYLDCGGHDGTDGSFKTLVNRLNELDQQAYEHLKFKRSGQNWKRAA